MNGSSSIGIALSLASALLLAGCDRAAGPTASDSTDRASDGDALSLAQSIAEDQIRSYIAEGISLAAAPKSAVAEYVAVNGVMPSSNAQAGLAPAGDLASRYVSSLSVQQGGEITITFAGHPDIDGQTIELRPAMQNNSIRWDCTGGTLDARFRPSSCR